MLFLNTGIKTEIGLYKRLFQIEKVLAKRAVNSCEKETKMEAFKSKIGYQENMTQHKFNKTSSSGCNRQVTIFFSVSQGT